MKLKEILACFIMAAILAACSDDKLEEKGFSIEQTTHNGDEAGISEDSLTSGLKMRPTHVLLTGVPEYRLVTVYKVNYDAKREKRFTGSNGHYQTYSGLSAQPGNAWHYHFMPGLEAMYGYNLLKIAHFNTKTQQQKSLFKSPVLIKTLYYPSYIQDTLNDKPVSRNYFMASVYDEDTNGDKLINVHDLRRLYHFDIEGENKSPLVPLNYSVLNSEYDPANDMMYVFAKLDRNGNGKRDQDEEIHIFWVDLKMPKNNGRLYQ